MEQMRIPDVIEGVDNQERERAFLTSLGSDSIKVEFPRSPYNKNHDPDMTAAIEYLESYTSEHPERSFLAFESMDLSTGYLFPHLVKVDLPEGQPPESVKEYVADYILELFAPFGKLKHESNAHAGRRTYYRLIHKGITYIGIDEGSDFGPVEFLGDRLYAYSDTAKPLSTMNS